MKGRISKLHAMVVFLVVIIVFALAVAHAEEKYVTDICASYSVWCDLFGVENFNSEITTGETTSGHYIHLDNIDVLYNENTFEWQRICFYCTSDIAMEDSDPLARLFAAFAAIEFGKPDEDSMKTDSKKDIYIAKIKASLIEISDDMTKCFDLKKDQIKTGKAKSFHVSDGCLYALAYLDNYGLFVIADKR